jgi:hypothetical protein
MPVDAEGNLIPYEKMEFYSKDNIFQRQLEIEVKLGKVEVPISRSNNMSNEAATVFARNLCNFITILPAMTVLPIE